MEFKPLGFIGFGNMGRAIAEGLIRSGRFKKEDFFVSVRSERSKGLLSEEGWNVVSNEEVAKKSALIFVAVKPKNAENVLKPLSIYIGTKPVVSVMAGVKLKRLEELLPTARVVRTMPNVNVAVGVGVWGVAFSERVSEGLRKKITELLALTGLVLEIDEKLMNSITALAGSGPAFVAELLDAFALAGVKMGFKYGDALKVALYTFGGTVEYISDRSVHPAAMRDLVCSPAGTTIYGVSKLNSEGIKGKLIEVVEGAKKRADEL